MALPIILQVLNRDKDKPPLLRLLLQFLRPHHRAVVAHDLTAQPARFQPRKPQQVNRRFGMPVALQDAVLFRQQREHMPRTAEVGRLRVVVNALHRRDGPLRRRNARGRGHVVNRYREGGFVVVGVVGDHLRELQFAHVLLRHGHTNQPFGVDRHKVDVFERGELRRANQIALVFAVGVVGNHNQFPRPESL